MNRPFLLIMEDSYYPESGTRDWVGCFPTREEAESQVETKTVHEYFTKGKRKGEVKSSHSYYYKKNTEGEGRRYDWYEIVDLRDWVQ